MEMPGKIQFQQMIILRLAKKKKTRPENWTIC